MYFKNQYSFKFILKHVRRRKQSMDFEMMIDETKAFLERNCRNECTATALFTDKGNLHIARCNMITNCCGKTDDDFSILNDLIESGESRILRMITLIKQGDRIGLDLPCEWLRNLICEMNDDNANTEVRGTTGEMKLLKDFVIP